jgi:peptide/nickel transport system substrate-binding protein
VTRCRFTDAETGGQNGRWNTIAPRHRQTRTSHGGNKNSCCPDEQLYENYTRGSERHYTGYCNRELESLFDQQSMEANPEKRKQLVWEIDRKLQEDRARPIISHNRNATCWHHHVKGLRMMVNSLFNGWRFEDVWLDK